MLDERRCRFLRCVVSLPCLVAAVGMALVLLAQHHRSDLIAQLCDVAAHGGTTSATAAVRQLAAMPCPPVTLLVTTATSPTRRVAKEAQSAINELMRRWYREAKTRRGQRRVARQLTTLVQSLADEQAAFSIGDYPWLGRITRQALRLANRFPPEMNLPIASQCETILAGIQSTDASVAAFVSAAPLATPEQRIAMAIAASATAATGGDRVTPSPAPETRVPGDEAVPNGVHEDATLASPDAASNAPSTPPATLRENRQPPTSSDSTTSDPWPSPLKS